MIGAMRTPDDARWYRLSLWALLAFAWVVLGVWGASPFAGLLSHRGIGVGPLSPLSRLAVFVFGWTLMTVAMMLPSSLPLVNLFRRLVAGRPDRGGLVVRLAVGYVAVWALFGAAAYRGDAWVHEAVAEIPQLAARSAWIGSAIPLAAGVCPVWPRNRTCLCECPAPHKFPC